MNSTLRRLFGTAACAAALAIPAVSQSAPSADGLLPGTPYISLQARGSVRKTPDLAVISMSTDSYSKEAGEAKKKVDDTVQAFSKYFSTLGYDRKYFVSEKINIEKQYEYDVDENGDRVKKFKCYKVSRTVKVKVPDFTKIGEVTDQALKTGIKSVDYISFEFSDKANDAARAEARKLAMENSKKQGQEIADTYGARLGHVWSVSHTQYETGGAVNARRSFKRNEVSLMAAPEAADDSAGLAMADSSYQPDEREYTDNVQVIFTLDYPADSESAK